jgi:hypothetical protein
MSPTSGQANNDTHTSLSSSAAVVKPLNGQRHNYGSLTHLNQPAVRARPGSSNVNANANAPSLPTSPKSRQQDATGSGTGTGAGAGTGAEAGVRTTATSHRSVQITVPDHDDENGNAHQNNDEDDTSSMSSRSSYSTYSSSTGSLEGLDLHNHKGSGHHGEDCGVEAEEEEEDSSRRMFWTYVALTPVLLSILALFAILLQFLPSSTESGEYIVHWGKLGLLR